MQVTETRSEGLTREFKVVVPASELDNRLVGRLTQIQGEVRIKGFRPGHVPVSHLRRLFGKQTMAEIVQTVVSDVARQTLTDRGERAATPPDYQLPEDQGEAERVLNGETDLAYTMSYDILPDVKLADFKTISVERPVAPVSEEEVQGQLDQLADNQRTFTKKDGKAENGDRLSISYLGKLDGEPFEGGRDDNAQVRLGSSQFIPGFVEQLEGMSAGDEKTITVTFPADYGAANLAGKEATFDIKVKEVAAPGEVAIDDELAKKLGLESLDKLRDAIRQQIQAQYTNASRQKVKRQLLDRLDELHAFDLPPKMVEQEFDNIWRQITAELASANRTFADEDTTEEAAREEYRKIAERRVRLGLIMSEIGERNKIEVTEEEVQRALAAQLRQFPGQEQVLLDYYRKNPDALAQLRAPIFEEKVVDYLLELVKVADKDVTREELLREGDDEAKAA